MKTAKVIGAGGYGGVGIVELLMRHPEVRVTTLVAREETGRPLSAIYPHLTGFCDLMVHAPDAPEAQAPADVVFFSTPDRVGMRGAGAELARGAKVIDYSGDFRFADPAAYADYAGRIGLETQHLAPEWLPDAVYGLPELGLDDLSRARIVGNPGCFAVSVNLGFAPAVKHGLIQPGSAIADCKTGVSGAGKKVNPSFHFPARHDNMNAYRLTGHQHVREIEIQMGRLGGREFLLTFTPQVVPATRGILSVCYGTLADGVTPAQVAEAYQEFYRHRPFVRILPASAGIGTAHVRGSNFCFLVVDVDVRTRRLRVVSHIDNLMKGQAGSALQNMNLLLGFPETLGLMHPGQYP
jgi:N-acetyl-gamma-glutamyl-phosphate reductase